MLVVVGDRTTRRRTCLTNASSTTATLWTGLGLKAGICGEKAATNRQNKGTGAVMERRTWVRPTAEYDAHILVGDNLFS
jgi:hypothetical protein